MAAAFSAPVAIVFVSSKRLEVGVVCAAGEGVAGTFVAFVEAAGAGAAGVCACVDAEEGVDGATAGVLLAGTAGGGFGCATD
jgi:hypothetical protein